MQLKKLSIIKIIFALLLLIIANGVAGLFYMRFDLTQNKRYTLSEASKNSIKKITAPVSIDVLLDGNMPAEFKRLQKETRYILEECSALNNNITFNFINPLEDEAINNDVIIQFQQLGLNPTAITQEEGAKVSQEFIFPWALANYGKKTVRIPLLKNTLGASTEERITKSIQALEYGFMDALVKLSTKKRKKIAVLKGNGELQDIYITDFLKTLKEYYNIAPFTLDSAAVHAERTLRELKSYDLVLVAKPTEAFSEREKYIVDQYLMNGGKMLWLIDQVAIEMEDLYAQGGSAIAIPRELNLKDMFFKYGVRIVPNLIQDLYFTQIVLATGEGNNTQYNPVPWLYAPMVFSANNHSINNQIEALRFQFANAIDTLANTIDKTILLTSSPLSKTIGVPAEIRLDMIRETPDRTTYNKGRIPMAVLLEGTFISVFKNRVKPFPINDGKDDGVFTKLIIISDGDLIKNDINKGQALELGYDKWTNNFYGNKEFLLNCVNVLLNDTGLMDLRSKSITLAFLDKERVEEQRRLWQWVSLGFPLIILLIFGGLFQYYRKKKYAV